MKFFIQKNNQQLRLENVVPIMMKKVKNDVVE